MVEAIYITSDGTYFEDHNDAVRHDRAYGVRCLDEGLNDVTPNRPTWDNVGYIYLPDESAYRHVRWNMEADDIIYEGIEHIGWVHWNENYWEACDSPV